MPEATPFQVMIVDDHPLMRRGVRQLLELDSGFEVVAEAGDGASAIDLANRLDIDVILLDLNMKGMSGLDTLNALRRDGVTAQIIILTVSDALKWSTKTGHRVRVFSSIDFPIRLVVTHHYIRAVLVRCNIQRYSPLLRELHR